MPSLIGVGSYGTAGDWLIFIVKNNGEGALKRHVGECRVCSNSNYIQVLSLLESALCQAN